MCTESFIFTFLLSKISKCNFGSRILFIISFASFNVDIGDQIFNDYSLMIHLSTKRNKPENVTLLS